MAKKLSTMVSLELDDEDKLDYPMPIKMDRPDFPCELQITLTTKSLAKLGVDPAEAKAGDYFSFEACARITHISSSDGPDGPESRVCAQIEQMCIDGDD